MPVGKPAPPRPRSPDVVTSARISSGGQRQRALQPLVAVMRAVILDGAGIDHAATCERQAGLPLQPGDFIREAEPQDVRAVARHRIEQGRDVRWAHRAVGDAAFDRCDLDHRLQPIEPARSVPDDLDRKAALFGRLLQGCENFTGADGNRAGIARNINAHLHRCASATSASIRASSSRPTTRPSSIADGAVAHRAEAIDRLQRHARVWCGVAERDAKVSPRRARRAHRRPQPGRLRHGRFSGT